MIYFSIVNKTAEVTDIILSDSNSSSFSQRCTFFNLKAMNWIKLARICQMKSSLFFLCPNTQVQIGPKNIISHADVNLRINRRGIDRSILTWKRQIFDLWPSTWSDCHHVNVSSLNLQATTTLARRLLTCPNEDHATQWHPYPSRPKYSSTSLRVISAFTSSCRIPTFWHEPNFDYLFISNAHCLSDTPKQTQKNMKPKKFDPCYPNTCS